MNSKQLIKLISKRTDLKESDVKKVIKEFNINIIESLLRLESVQIKGVCKLDPTIMTSKKLISNFKNQKEILEIGNRVKVRFTIQKNLKELLKNILIKKDKSIDIKEYFKQFNLD